MIYVPARHWKGAAMTHEDGTTPLNHLVKVLRLGDPSEYRGHTYISGGEPVLPHRTRVRRAGDRAVADRRVEDGLAQPAPPFGARVFHRGGRYTPGFAVRRGDPAGLPVVLGAQGQRDAVRRPILTAIASFQEQGQSGVEFSDTMPQDVPAPETLTSAKELMEPYADKSPFAKFYAKKSPFDIRHVTPTIMLGADKDSAAHDSGKQLVWMKADGVADVPQVMHRAMLALGCDQVMMEPVLRRAGLSISTPGISYASIDHSMWWYRDVDINQWHLYVQDTPTAAHGRGLGVAKVYTQDGELVAAMAQEAMIRVPQQ